MLLMVSCSKDDNNNNTPTKATRAVMVYMAAENNLTEHNGVHYLRNDLQEMLEGSPLLSDDQRLFVFVDSLGTNSKYKGNPYIVELHNGQAIERKTFSSDFYSCDPERFREVLSWMTTNISADSYGLVLWGHASGWLVTNDTIASSRRAYGLDTNKDLAGGDKWMNITQMAEALKGLPKMEFIFADCCNMMCAEVGYELRNATNYLIGSPAEIPGDGAPYDKILPTFYKNGSELYKGIIDTYYDYYLKSYQNSYLLSGYSVPLSVINTSYMAQLASQTHDVLEQFSTAYPSYPDSPDMTGLAFYLGIDQPMLYDMRAFIKRNAPASVFQQWDNCYQQAVPYYRMSMKWMTIYKGSSSYDLQGAMDTFDQDESQYGCVSMFIPRNLTAYNSGTYAYNKRANNFGWNRVLNWSRFGW